MLKTISLSLVLILLTSSAYSASTLKEALTTYSYAVEVEWDQKDPAILAAHQERLEKDIAQLLEVQSPEDLLEEALTLSGPTQSEAARTLVNQYAAGEIQSLEFHQKMFQLYESSRMKGASWIGVTTLAIGAVSVLAIYYLAIRIYMYEWGKRF